MGIHDASLSLSLSLATAPQTYTMRMLGGLPLPDAPHDVVATTQASTAAALFQQDDSMPTQNKDVTMFA